MPELRTCPVTGRTVLLHPGWIDRPAPPADAGACAWCRPGVLQHAQVLAQLNGVRAVAHPVPALSLDGQPVPAASSAPLRRDAFGAHELVVGPHVAREATLLRVLAARVNDLRRDGRLRGFHASRRARKGHHAAWQLFGLPWERAPEPVAAWRTRERADGARTLVERDGAFAAMAWAPRAPFEAWVVPLEGDAPFGAQDPVAVADAVARVAREVSRALRDPPIDLVLVDGAPWRVEIVPRLEAPGALEVAAGVPIHGVLPERAAMHLRGQRRADEEES